MPQKIADGDRRRRQLSELTNVKAGQEILAILTRWTNRTCQLDIRIKQLVDNAPGTLGQIIATLPSALQAEATTLITAIDEIRQNHKPTGT